MWLYAYDGVRFLEVRSYRCCVRSAYALSYSCRRNSRRGKREGGKTIDRHTAVRTWGEGVPEGFSSLQYMDPRVSVDSST